MKALAENKVNQQTHKQFHDLYTKNTTKKKKKLGLTLIIFYND